MKRSILRMLPVTSNGSFHCKWLKHHTQLLYQVVRCLGEAVAGWGHCQWDDGFITNLRSVSVFLRMCTNCMFVIHSSKPNLTVVVNLGWLLSGWQSAERNVTKRVVTNRLFEFHCGRCSLQTIVSAIVSFLLFQSICLLFPFLALLHCIEVQYYVG